MDLCGSNRVVQESPVPSKQDLKVNSELEGISDGACFEMKIEEF